LVRGITVGVPEKESSDVGIGVSVGGNGEYVGRGMDVKVAVGIAVCFQPSQTLP
jgi:hypothetical protein